MSDPQPDPDEGGTTQDRIRRELEDSSAEASTGEERPEAGADEDVDALPSTSDDH